MLPRMRPCLNKDHVSSLPRAQLLGFDYGSFPSVGTCLHISSGKKQSCCNEKVKSFKSPNEIMFISLSCNHPEVGWLSWGDRFNGQGYPRFFLSCTSSFPRVSGSAVHLHSSPWVNEGGSKGNGCSFKELMWKLYTSHLFTFHSWELSCCHI